MKSNRAVSIAALALPAAPAAKAQTGSQDASENAAEKLPVIAWIYGGGFTGRMSSAPLRREHCALRQDPSTVRILGHSAGGRPAYPHGPGLPSWPAFTQADPLVTRIGVNPGRPPTWSG